MRIDGKGDRVKQFFGKSTRGDIQEAVRGLNDPKLLLLLSNTGQFETHVKALQELYPDVPSIGCIGMSYDSAVVEKGVGIIGFCGGIGAVVNVLEHASTMPVKYISRLEQDVESVRAAQRDTVCIDFCSGNDACVLNTIHSVLKHREIPLVGGTGDGGKVSMNGRVYEDAAVYALIKNQGGKVKAYKENIYHQFGKQRFVASKTDRARYFIGELNGKPARLVYQDMLHITQNEIQSQTFKNPFGKINGTDTCIISIKEVEGNGLSCYRQVNDSDVLILLELGDYKQTVQHTIQMIRKDFPKLSAVFSINCLFRYLLFSENHYMQEYLRDMGALGSHAGVVGYGEHFNNQFVNQSMTCVVFE